MILPDFRRMIRLALLSSELDPGNFLLVVVVNLSIIFSVFAFCQ
jgi:hypothetical protein